MTDSIALVVLDAVRTDAFDDQFEWLPGTRYDRVYSTSHWTVPVHATLLTGLLPRETGTYAGSPSFSPPVRSLPERLRDAGYRTRLYSANLQLVQWDGWTDGFDDVVGPETDLFDWMAAKNDAAAPGPLAYLAAVGRCLVSDAPLVPSLRQGWRMFTEQDTGLSTADLRRDLENREPTDGPEFALFNLMEAHSSAGVSTGEAIADGIDDPVGLRRNYDDAVAELADEYRDLFAVLDREFDVVVTLSDHGELLGEHDLTGHGYGIFPELVEVPLVVSGADDRLQYPADGLVSLTDVEPTIAALAGIDATGGDHSLINPETRATALVERTGQPHLHREMFERFGIADQFEDYDAPLCGLARAAGGYAYETMDGVATAGDWTGDPRTAIEEAFEGIDRYEGGDNDHDVSDDVRDQLQDLGYA